MATTTISGAGGTTTSFSNTPQAQGDVFNYTEDNVVIVNAAQSIILLDVMANDLGGNAKTLFSVDDGISASTATKQYAPIDLTTQDVQATGISNWESIGGGVSIRINNGKVEMDLSQYLLSHGFTSLQALGAGDNINETFTYAIKLGNGTLSWASVSVNIQGKNDGATITAAAAVDNTVVEAGGVANGTPGDPSAHGQLIISDVDLNENHFQTPPSLQGTYGTFTFDATSGAWTYALNQTLADPLTQGQQVTDMLQVKSADGTATYNIVVNITGTNDAAVVSHDVRNLTEGNAAADISTSGTLTISDVDSDPHFVAQAGTAGLYGTFAIDADGAWTYTASSAHDEFVAGTTYTDTFNVVSADGTPTTVTINILGTNDAAVLSSDVKNLTETNAAADISTSGTLTISDVDSDPHFVAQAGTAGLYGTFAIDADGAWTYTASSAHDEFVAGTTYTDTFNVVSADGTPTTVTINILGTNDAAVITLNGAQDTSVTEKSGVANGTPGDATASGDLNATDVDNAATFTAQVAVAKSYGTFSIDANGTWSYTLDDNNATVQALNSSGANTTLYELVTVTTVDGTQQVIDITINGANDAAVITVNGVQDTSVTEKSGVANGTPGDATASGDLNASDVDNAATFNTQVAVAKSYGTFSIDANGTWSYTLDDNNATVQALNSTGANTTLHELVTVTTVDGTQQVIDITINGANDAAVLSSASVNLTEGNAAADISTSGTLTISDVDSSATFVVQAATAGLYGTFAINAAGAWTYTASSAHDEFIAGQHYTENFDVVSADGTHTSIAIDILGTDDGPPRFAPTDIQLTPSTTTADVSFSSFQFTGTLSATDPDPGGSFVYSITSQSDPGLFSISGNTLSSSLSGLSPSKAYSITVQATQVGDPAGPTYQYSETFQVITGSNGNSSDGLNGANGGDDVLYGNGGADIILGMAGNDTLFGQDGNDTLNGGDGNDRLVGGVGADTLTGGLGADTFYYGSAISDSPVSVANDTITDFVHGVDKIDLSSIDANTVSGGDQAFLFGGFNAATVANSITWSEVGGNTIVRVDVNGNATADFQITLTGTGLGLTASDFVL
ncbi:adhesin [Mesorhizobium sp. M3A.F.Ca.ET.174.01.1.1]|nr:MULTISPECIES: VCBS domain-containing protein [unclassified Mesorhizobium]TGS89610.1 adhesin [Mesorhizobium sp. M3A.F.Ca.ET.175.01.1.1]TGT31383.1 adhesin [Mesorhizobium sp. M3A.F.Ca.ET.174.01.1.1]